MAWMMPTTHSWVGTSSKYGRADGFSLRHVLNSGKQKAVTPISIPYLPLDISIYQQYKLQKSQKQHAMRLGGQDRSTEAMRNETGTRGD